MRPGGCRPRGAAGSRESRRRQAVAATTGTSPHGYAASSGPGTNRSGPGTRPEDFIPERSDTCMYPCTHQWSRCGLSIPVHSLDVRCKLKNLQLQGTCACIPASAQLARPPPTFPVWIRACSFAYTITDGMHACTLSYCSLYPCGHSYTAMHAHHPEDAAVLCSMSSHHDATVQSIR